MKKGNIKIFYSHEEAQEDYEKEVYAMTPEERVSAVEELRRRYFLLKGKPIDLNIKKVLEIVRG